MQTKDSREDDLFLARREYRAGGQGGMELTRSRTTEPVPRMFRGIFFTIDLPGDTASYIRRFRFRHAN